MWKFCAETPTPNNPLGVKAAGEGGTLPAAAVIAAAIDDALSPFGVRFRDTQSGRTRLFPQLKKRRVSSRHSL